MDVVGLLWIYNGSVMDKLGLYWIKWVCNGYSGQWVCNGIMGL